MFTKYAATGNMSSVLMLQFSLWTIHMRISKPPGVVYEVKEISGIIGIEWINVLAYFSVVAVLLYRECEHLEQLISDELRERKSYHLLSKLKYCKHSISKVFQNCGSFKSKLKCL